MPTSKLLIFSDIHTDWRTLERILSVEADFYIAAGDQATWGRGLDRCGQVLRTRSEKVWVLPGNHESAPQIATFCEQYGLHNFHERQFAAGTWHVAGLGYSSPTPFDTPGEYSEEEMAEQLSKFVGLSPLVMICHSPPLNTQLDRIHDGLHGGSSAVMAFIEKVQPLQFFCGHIHEAEGKVIQIGKTRAMNVGKKGYLLEL